MSAPVRVAVAVSNSNTSFDKTRLGKGISRTLARQSFKLWQSKVSRKPPLAGEIAKNRALLGRFSPPNKSGFHGGTLPFRLYRLYCGRLFSPPTLFFIPVFSFFSFHFVLFIPENFAFKFSRMPSSHLLMRNTYRFSKETALKFFNSKILQL